MTQTLIETKAEPAVSCPTGFLASGMACGIKPSGADDVALILCPEGAAAAAMFTRNLVRAAPVVLSHARLERSGGRMRALVINSGCANAATGEEGARRAMRVMDALAEHIHCPPEQALMNSTGVIGVLLPDDLIVNALPQLVTACSPDGLSRAASAIMTTDTTRKVTQQVVRDGERECRVVGIAKGAGMIHPNMATMIAVIMTDAEIEPEPLDHLMRGAVERSFHRITVDGDTSTNDAVFMLSSGAAGVFSAELLAPAINQVARDLARMIVRDAEGASRLIRVRIGGARTAAEALQVAQTVASSLLVRTSVAGGDPNWGRILAAAGRSGVEFDPEQVTLRINNITVYAQGRVVPVSQAQLEAAYAADEVVIDIDLKQGQAFEEFLTCDLTEQYVRINADYTS